MLLILSTIQICDPKDMNTYDQVSIIYIIFFATGDSLNCLKSIKVLL